ncbi:hypothetical protein LF1_08500 [Rubripirellula obstinata]|uniref:Outer membrane lipoprotein-sorting protein n=1 Tax=Rubripirellula obstinata TaxID=406547 RepID=A0A5B1CFR4_9BACT|nr:hypothetical protein [Rubripirellula obstinata]KAA1258333.1 hypothetical protein LF1_08500 [Rubripirellula obstinata]
MRSHSSTYYRLTHILTSLLVVTALLADTSVAEEPVGFDVLKRCAKVSGGLDAFAKVNSITMKATISVSQQGVPASNSVQGTLESHFIAPDRAIVIVDLGSLGKSTRGVQGEIAWESSDSGNRKLKPSERKRLLDSISLRETFEPTSVFASFTNRGKEMVDGEPCYRVEVSRRGNDEADQIYYSVKSGLPMRTIATRHTMGGDRVVDSKVNQYKTYKGLQVATEIRQLMQSFKLIHDVKVHTVEINGKIDESVFTPPADLEKS